MIAQLPTLLALLGTALLAIAIFAPHRSAPAGPAVSFAPPEHASFAPPGPASFAPPLGAVSFAPSPGHMPVEPPVPFADWAPPDPFVFVAESEPETDELADAIAVRPVLWPTLVDPSAAGCDGDARLALVEGLLAVRAPWSEALLRRAAAEERDPRVSAALASAGFYAAGTP